MTFSEFILYFTLLPPSFVFFFDIVYLKVLHLSTELCAKECMLRIYFKIKSSWHHTFFFLIKKVNVTLYMNICSLNIDLNAEVTLSCSQYLSAFQKFCRHLPIVRSLQVFSQQGLLSQLFILLSLEAPPLSPSPSLIDYFSLFLFLNPFSDFQLCLLSDDCTIWFRLRTT